jgi:hypothetical protein
MAEKDKLPGVNEWEPEVMEFIYPVVPTTAQVTRDAEDRVFALKAAGSALGYLPAADPREDIANLVAAHSRPFADTFCENTYLRFFGHTPDDCVVLAVAKGRTADAPLTPDCVRLHARPVRKHREQKAGVRIHGGELILRVCLAWRIHGVRPAGADGGVPGDAGGLPAGFAPLNRLPGLRKSDYA